MASVCVWFMRLLDNLRTDWKLLKNCNDANMNHELYENSAKYSIFKSITIRNYYNNWLFIWFPFHTSITIIPLVCSAHQRERRRIKCPVWCANSYFIKHLFIASGGQYNSLLNNIILFTSFGHDLCVYHDFIILKIRVSVHKTTIASWLNGKFTIFLNFDRKMVKLRKVLNWK